MEKPKLKEELAKPRARGFVGRKDELEAFEACLEGCTSCRTLLIHGPGGVGKTTLVDTFAHQARENGRPVRKLAGDKLATAPGSLKEALRAQTEGLGEGGLLLVDDFEALAGWESCLREEVLPQLPGGLRVVLSGRWSPAPEWRTDPGWRAITRILQIGDFSLSETRDYLRQQGLERRAEEIHHFTRGHPLALALATDILEKHPDSSLEWEEQPELVESLVARHLRDVDSPHERLLLHAAALPARIDTPMLSAMTDSANPEADLAWLRGRHFIRHEPDGLRMHDLVSEALRVEMGRMAPERHRDLIRRGIEELCRRRDHGSAQADPWEVSYLVRDHPLVRRALPRPGEAGVGLGPARKKDLPFLAHLVSQLQGEEARGWFGHWADHQPEGITVLRGPDGKPKGITFYIDPWGPGAEEQAGDPVVELFREYLTERGLLRAGETARLGRFFLVENDPTLTSPEATQLRSYSALHIPELPGLVFSGCALPANEELEAFYRLINLPALEECRFSVDGKDYYLTGHDWRLEPPGEWLRRAALRAVDPTIPFDTAAPVDPLSAGLPRPEFGEAVRNALKALSRSRGLSGNPLLETPLAQEGQAESNTRSPEEVLENRLRRAIHDLEQTPGSRELGKTLRVTYLESSLKQIAAAEILGMSFGTFRRRHRQGVERLIERLWDQARAIAIS